MASPKQSRGKETRSKILLAAMDSLVEQNVHGLRFAQIAKRAHVVQPLMDYHFPNLESLLMEMVMFQIEQLREASTQAIESNIGNPYRALAAYIRAPFVVTERDARFRAVWSCFYHLAAIHEHFAVLNGSIRSVGRDRILALVKGCVEFENSRQNRKPSAPIAEAEFLKVAVGIQGLITGLGFITGTDPKANAAEMADLAVFHAEKLVRDLCDS